MRHAVALVILLLISSGCELSSRHIPETISEARARWRTNNLLSYTIDKTRVCECPPPYSYTAVVEGGRLVDVRYDLPEHDEKHGGPLYENHEHLLATVMTVEELFDVLEHYETRAARFEVSFHPRYGYPTEIFIDPSLQIADEEIIRELSNLKRIRK